MLDPKIQEKLACVGGALSLLCEQYSSMGERLVATAQAFLALENTIKEAGTPESETEFVTQIPPYESTS